jgi:hypothetical protein
MLDWSPPETPPGHDDFGQIQPDQHLSLLYFGVSVAERNGEIEKDQSWLWADRRIEVG